MYFEITVNDDLSTTTGADKHTSMVLQLRWNSGGQLEDPKLWVDSFKARDDDIERHYKWDIGHLCAGDELRIRLLERGDASPPSKIDGKRPPFFKDEEILMGKAITNLKQAMAALENIDWEKEQSRRDFLFPGDKTVCSFCGKDKSEVVGLVAGPSVSICNECVLLSVQVLTDPDCGI